MADHASSAGTQLGPRFEADLTHEDLEGLVEMAEWGEKVRLPGGLALADCRALLRSGALRRLESPSLPPRKVARLEAAAICDEARADDVLVLSSSDGEMVVSNSRHAAEVQSVTTSSRPSPPGDTAACAGVTRVASDGG